MKTTRIGATGIMTAALISTGPLGGCGSDIEAPETCAADQVYTNAGCLPVPDWAPITTRPIGDLDLSGPWALEVSSTQVVSHPQADPAAVRIVWQALVQITQTDLQIRMDTELCALDPQPYAESQFRYPQMTLQAYRVTAPVARLDELRVGATFSAQNRAHLAGWEPANSPTTEALPETASDPRLIDGDGDNLPGVLEEVTGAINGVRRIAVRDLMDLDGQVVSEDRVEGFARVERAQTIVDATDAWLESPLTFEPTNDRQEQRFTMVRLVNDAANCASVIGL